MRRFFHGDVQAGSHSDERARSRGAHLTSSWVAEAQTYDELSRRPVHAPRRRPAIARFCAGPTADLVDGVIDKLLSVRW